MGRTSYKEADNSIRGWHEQIMLERRRRTNGREGKTISSTEGWWRSPTWHK